MPKHSSGNFKNSNHNLSSDHHQQPQNFSQQLEQVRGGTTTTHLSYENLSSSVPSGGAHSTNNPMYFQQHENSPHQQHPNSLKQYKNLLPSTCLSTRQTNEIQKYELWMTQHGNR